MCFFFFFFFLGTAKRLSHNLNFVPQMEKVNEVKKQFKGTTGEELVLWKKPLVSGVVLGLVFFVYLLLGYLEYSFVTLSCRFLQLGIVIVGLLKKTAGVQIDPEGIAGYAGQFLDSIHPHVVKGSELVGKVITWEDPKVSLQALVASILCAMLGNMFGDILLAFLIVLLIFTVPKAYKSNQKLIDDKVEIAKKKADELLEKVPAVSKLMKQKDQ